MMLQRVVFIMNSGIVILNSDAAAAISQQNYLCSPLSITET